MLERGQEPGQEKQKHRLAPNAGNDGCTPCCWLYLCNCWLRDTPLLAVSGYVNVWGHTCPGRAWAAQCNVPWHDAHSATDGHLPTRRPSPAARTAPGCAASPCGTGDPGPEGRYAKRSTVSSGRSRLVPCNDHRKMHGDANYSEAQDVKLMHARAKLIVSILPANELWHCVWQII